MTVLYLRQKYFQKRPKEYRMFIEFIKDIKNIYDCVPSYILTHD